MKKGEIQSHVESLQKYNDQLARLCNIHRILEDIETDTTKPSRKAGKITSSLVNVQEHAQRLFEAMSSKWTNCHPQHEMNVWLDPRLDSVKASTKYPSSGHRGRHVLFRVGLGIHENEVGRGLQWYYTRVLPHDLAMKKATTVKIQVPDDDDWPDQSVAVQEITDLCASIWQANQSQKCLYFFIKSGQLRAFAEGNQAAPTLLNKQQCSATLAMLYKDSPGASSFTRLDLSQRLRIAICLASTVFQFGE